DGWIKEVEARAHATLKEAAQEIEAIHTVRMAGVRYAGQGYEVSVPYDRLDELPERFRQEYARLYGPRDDEAPLEVISIRATVVGTTHKAAPVWAGDNAARKALGARR